MFRITSVAGPPAPCGRPSPGRRYGGPRGGPDGGCAEARTEAGRSSARGGTLEAATSTFQGVLNNLRVGSPEYSDVATGRTFWIDVHAGISTDMTDCVASPICEFTAR